MVGLSLHRAIFLAVSLASPTPATDIQGTIIVQHKLTKRRVTAPIGAYDRGTLVDLRKDPAEDTLSFERERVIVYLEGDVPSPAASITGEIVQQNRRFLPDTVWIPAGSSVSFPNLDPIFHNIFSLSKPKAFDLGNYPKDHSRTVVFPKPGIVYVNCHLHPNMSAAIVVTPNHWGVKAGPDGKFTLAGVPHGSYSIAAWHKTAGIFRQTVTVDEKPVSIVFFIPIGENPPAREN